MYGEYLSATAGRDKRLISESGFLAQTVLLYVATEILRL